MRFLPLFLLLLASVWPVGASSPTNLVPALAAQEELVASQPTNGVAWNDFGNLLVLAGRYAEAEDAYRRAIPLADDEAVPRFNLALLLQQSGRDDEAEAELLAILEADADHAWAHYQLGILLAARRDRSNALEHYAQALALDPALSFASNNSHILDNPLFGEALLLSQRYRDKPGETVPRHYGEPDRIVDLLLQEKAGEGEGADAGKGEEVRDEEDAAGAPSPARGPDGTPQAAFESAPRGTAPAAPGTTLRTSPGTRAVVPGQPTPLGAGDRPETAAPTPRDPAQTASPPRPRTVSPSARRPPAQPRGSNPTPGRTTPRATPPGQPLSTPPSAPRQTPPQAEPDRPRSGSRYIPPGRPSTAQLKLKLLPAEPASG